MSVEEARAYLKSKGYYVDNLWHVDDVKSLVKPTDEQLDDSECMEVLDYALQGDGTMRCVWDALEDGIYFIKQQ